MMPKYPAIRSKSFCARITQLVALLAVLILAPALVYAAGLANGFGLNNLNLVAVTYTYSWTGHFPGKGEV